MGGVEKPVYIQLDTGALASSPGSLLLSEPRESTLLPCGKSKDT